jgi:hypothetical protein
MNVATILPFVKYSLRYSPEKSPETSLPLCCRFFRLNCWTSPHPPRARSEQPCVKFGEEIYYYVLCGPVYDTNRLGPPPIPARVRARIT